MITKSPRVVALEEKLNEALTGDILLCYGRNSTGFVISPFTGKWMHAGLFDKREYQRGVKGSVRYCIASAAMATTTIKNCAGWESVEKWATDTEIICFRVKGVGATKGERAVDYAVKKIFGTKFRLPSFRRDIEMKVNLFNKIQIPISFPSKTVNCAEVVYHAWKSQGIELGMWKGIPDTESKEWGWITPTEISTSPYVEKKWNIKF